MQNRNKKAYTPRDQKAVKSAAQTFRSNPVVDVEEVITQLGVGEALVSFLDPKGIPTPVERAFIIPPSSQIGNITESNTIGREIVRGLLDLFLEGKDDKKKGKIYKLPFAF